MYSAPTRRSLERHSQEIRDLFAEPLAARLGRTADEIRDGLGARDFPGNEDVEVTFVDGSTMSFRYAFVVFDAAQGIAGVFTEHCGYYCFGTGGIAITERRDGNVFARHERCLRAARTPSPRGRSRATRAHAPPRPLLSRSSREHALEHPIATGAGSCRGYEVGHQISRHFRAGIGRSLGRAGQFRIGANYVTSGWVLTSGWALDFLSSP